MAKEKQDKVGEDIFQFMKSQNRPYSLNDLVQSSSLKEHGKAALSKSLDQLIVVSFVFPLCTDWHFFFCVCI